VFFIFYFGIKIYCYCFVLFFFFFILVVLFFGIKKIVIIKWLLIENFVAGWGCVCGAYGTVGGLTPAPPDNFTERRKAKSLL
ncbi:hypothetical protein ACVGXP_00395, partial [Enterobacter hormaechei]